MKKDNARGTRDNLISKQDAIDAAIEAVDEWDGGCNLTRANMIADAINNTVPPAQTYCTDCVKNGADWDCDHVHCHKGKRMSNKEWVDFLSEQFDVSRTSAREMLHGLMKWKRKDNFKKQIRRNK